MGGVKKKRGLTQNFAAGRTFPILPAAFYISKLVRNHRLRFRPALFHRLLVAHGVGANRRYLRLRAREVDAQVTGEVVVRDVLHLVLSLIHI